MTGTRAVLPGGWRSLDSIWQLVECCGYTADLPSWESICGGGPVLDLGCGIGRVGRDLDERGATVVGVDSDPGMIEDFERLSSGNANAVRGDVLDPALDPGRFAKVIAPQQLIQIVGGPPERATLLDLFARSLDPGGSGGLAITEQLPRDSLEPDLTPDLRELEGWVFSSRPVALAATDDAVAVERLRQRVSPEGHLLETRDKVTFRRVSRDSLRPELRLAGLKLEEAIDIPPTDTHMASCILVVTRP